MSRKNVCALEFACIFGRNIKCSVIIIISLLDAEIHLEYVLF